MAAVKVSWKNGGLLKGILSILQVSFSSRSVLILAGDMFGIVCYYGLSPILYVYDEMTAAIVFRFEPDCIL